jgi:hypothetical protein
MFSLFAKKVKVTFINNTNGELIGINKMKPEQLPESFDRPTTMHLQEEEWTVAVRSANNIYYGTLEDDIIKELCLQEFDSVGDEFSKLVSQFELVLVLWCRGQITTV